MVARVNFMRDLFLRETGGMLPAQEFFRPTPAFLHWLKVEYAGDLIYDVGAGMGHVTVAMRKVGLKAVGIDLNFRPGQRSDCVIPANAVDFSYAPGSVLMFFRPCHGFFVETVIREASEVGVGHFLIVSASPDDAGRYRHRLQHVHPSAGEEGEEAWRLLMS